MSYESAWKYLEVAGGAGKGGRNDALNRLSYALMATFPDLSQVEHMELMQRWSGTCSPPIEQSEVVKTASSAWHGVHRNGAVGANKRAEGSRPPSQPRATTNHLPRVPLGKSEAEKLPPKVYDIESQVSDAMPSAMTDGTIQMLKSVFKPGELIRIVPAVAGDDGGEIPDGQGFVFKQEEWISRLEKVGGNPNGIWSNSQKTGIYIGINPGGTKDSDITDYRHALVEFDEGLTIAQQWTLYQVSRLPIAAVIYSGGKSVHAWVRVDAKSKEEYQNRVGMLYGHFEDSGLKLDPHNRNPARLSRLPGCVRFSKRQELLALNMGCESWDAWVDDIKSGELATATTPSELRDYAPFCDMSGLIGDRWLCKGGSLMIVGPSGVGKSSLTMQLAVSWAAGIAVFGVAPVRPLKILIVQAENDFGDLAEQFQGVCAGLGYDRDPEVEQLVDRNLLFFRDTSHTGFGWIDSVHRLIRKHKPDIVIGDPLLSFVGGDISRQEVCGQFLRNWLGPVSESTGVAWVFIHHTGKPPSDKEARKGWQTSDWAYAGIGSSELTNWARAVVSLRQAGSNTFTLTFAKRGPRSGAKHPDGCPTDTIWIKHSDKGICWVQLDPPEDDADDGDGDSGNSRRGHSKNQDREQKLPKPARVAAMNLHEFLSGCKPEGESLREIAQRLEIWLATQRQAMSRSTCVTSIRDHMVPSGKLSKGADLLYRKGPNA